MIRHSIIGNIKGNTYDSLKLRRGYESTWDRDYQRHSETKGKAPQMDREFDGKARQYLCVREPAESSRPMGAAHEA